MGEVYLAEDRLLNRPCALKVIASERAADLRTLQRFEREVSVTARLNHPNIVKVYHGDYAEDGTFYCVMEYVPGFDLQKLVSRYGALPPERALYFLKQAGAALQYAHAASMIHRDVKPQNMIVCGPPGELDQLKLVDFGLVRETNRPVSGKSLSHDGGLLGSPSYMSPEQALGARELDARSDIYSLGAVAYFVLTGQPPFVRDSDLEVLMAHVDAPVVPPSRLRSGISAGFEAIVLRCLEKDPGKRFASAAVLVESLSQCASVPTWTESQATNWWHANPLEGTKGSG
jgi:eukaryotic-like serine/threonine-protein kinase